MAAPPKEITKIGRLLSYVLGRQPDEFGLIPNDQGYIPTKALLKALHQEEGWRHLRMAHLNQLIVMMRPAPVEIEGPLIRATDRTRLPAIQQPKQLPKLLYMAIRRRAYASALTKGLSAGNRPYMILSSDHAMAKKMGCRLDSEPIVLTIQVSQSQTNGTRYQQYGESLFLADTLAMGTFSGPAPPKQKEPALKNITPAAPKTPKTPGSYFPEMGPTTEEKETLKRQRRRQKMVKEKERRQDRKRKSRRQM